METNNNGKIVISTTPDITDKELVWNNGGARNYCSWDRLKPYLAAAAGNTSADNIKGVLIDENEVEILLKD